MIHSDRRAAAGDGQVRPDRRAPRLDHRARRHPAVRGGGRCAMTRENELPIDLLT